MDGGRTWQAAGGRLSLAGAGALAVSSLAVSPGDDQVVYVAAIFSMATPGGLHSIPLAFIGVDDGRRWFKVMGAGRCAWRRSRRQAHVWSHRRRSPRYLIADVPASYWILAAMAALLVFMGTLMGRGRGGHHTLGFSGRNRREASLR